jgi:hypothetical protein
MQKKQSFWKKLWWFLWEDNSIWSWLANIVLAFVLIKFVIYPVLGLLLGTGYPIVAVVSSSMEHDGSFDEWWNTDRCCLDSSCTKRVSPREIYAGFGITEEQFRDFSFKNGFDKGDIMILRGPGGAEVGDILVFWTDSRTEPIIHRIVQQKGVANAPVFKTKGDHNCASAGFEQSISKDRFIGKAAIRIPFLGWIKIGFVELLKLVGLVG